MTLEKLAEIATYQELMESGLPQPGQTVEIPVGKTEPEDITVLEIEDPQEDDGTITFMLDEVPGAPGAAEIVVEDDDKSDIEVEDKEKDEVEVSSDPWDWASRGLSGFLAWLKERMDDVPKHTGYDTTGLEKAVAYFETLEKEITKAMRQDYKNEIDSAQAERAREQIENGIERLVDRLEKVKTTKFKRHQKKTKKGWAEAAGLVKEAQKSTRITGITITVPLFISRIARVCINGMVSAGHDLEELFATQVKEYDLTKREQAELAQLLADCGYALRQDRGFTVGKVVDKEKSDNRDWAANYNG